MPNSPPVAYLPHKRPYKKTGWKFVWKNCTGQFSGQFPIKPGTDTLPMNFELPTSAHFRIPPGWHCWFTSVFAFLCQVNSPTHVSSITSPRINLLVSFSMWYPFCRNSSFSCRPVAPFWYGNASSLAPQLLNIYIYIQKIICIYIYNWRGGHVSKQCAPVDFSPIENCRA